MKTYFRGSNPIAIEKSLENFHVGHQSIITTIFSAFHDIAKKKSDEAFDV